MKNENDSKKSGMRINELLQIQCVNGKFMWFVICVKSWHDIWSLSLNCCLTSDRSWTEKLVFQCCKILLRYSTYPCVSGETRVACMPACVLENYSYVVSLLDFSPYHYVVDAVVFSIVDVVDVVTGWFNIIHIVSFTFQSVTCHIFSTVIKSLSSVPMRTCGDIKLPGNCRPVSPIFSQSHRIDIVWICLCVCHSAEQRKCQFVAFSCSIRRRYLISCRVFFWDFTNLFSKFKQSAF